jgi:hypothetical protein
LRNELCIIYFSRTPGRQEKAFPEALLLEGELLERAVLRKPARSAAPILQ